MSVLLTEFHNLSHKVIDNLKIKEKNLKLWFSLDLKVKKSSNFVIWLSTHEMWMRLICIHVAVYEVPYLNCQLNYLCDTDRLWNSVKKNILNIGKCPFKLRFPVSSQSKKQAAWVGKTHECKLKFSGLPRARIKM